MQIDGTTYLLAKCDRGREWVARYLLGEIDEIFTDADRASLERGESVRVAARHGAIRYVNMVAAARAVAD